MQFMYPLFLLGALSLAIPIILHLFYFRRFKKVYFTNVRFLREVQEETSARSRLRNLLTLLMRLLAILFLVLAFAQPFIPGSTAQKRGFRAVSVYIDNSFSMSALSKDIPLLEQARAQAREVVQSYGPDDQFQILSNDFSGRQQRLLSREDAFAAIDDILLSPDSRNLSKVLERQKQALSASRSTNYIAYQISDFQRTVMDIQRYTDTTMSLYLLPMQAVQERNVSIDSVWFDAPVQMLNQTNPVIVRVKNHGTDPVENIRLSLEFDGQTKPVGTRSIPPKATVTDTVNITILKTGWLNAKMSLTDYPIQFDDHYFFSFPVAQQIRVLDIHEGSINTYLDAAIRGLPQFELVHQNSQSLEYSKFSDYQLIVLSDLNTYSSGLANELQRYAENGGNVLIFPGAEANLESLRSVLRTFSANEPISFDKSPRQVSEVNTDAFVFEDVFEQKTSNFRLPAVQGSFRFVRGSNRGEEVLLRFREGASFLSQYRAGKGHLFVCASPLADRYSNLVQNGEIFVPMLYKMAIASNTNRRIAYTIGQDELLEASRQSQSAEAVYKLTGPGGEFIPEQRQSGNTVFLGANGQVREAGHYTLFLQPEKTLHQFSFNYDRKESSLDYFDAEGLLEYAGPLVQVMQAKNETVLAAKIEEQSQGTALWRWCLFIGVLFLTAEALILRFWK